MKRKVVLISAAILFSGICSARESKKNDSQSNGNSGKTKIIVAATVFTVVGTVFSYECWPKTVVPQVVKDAAKAKFPNATEFEEWEKEGNRYEVEAEQGEDYEVEACFSAEGAWLWTKQELKKSDLPKAIQDAIAASDYKDWDVDNEVIKIENPENPNGVYIIEVEKGKEEVMLTFSADGKISKSEKDND